MVTYTFRYNLGFNSLTPTRDERKMLEVKYVPVWSVRIGRFFILYNRDFKQIIIMPYYIKKKKDISDKKIKVKKKTDYIKKLDKEFSLYIRLRDALPNGYFKCIACGKLHKKISSELGISLVGDKTVCPHCHAKLKLEKSRKCKFEEKWYFTIITTCKGFQVCRHFIIEKQMFKVCNNIEGCNRPSYYINEAVQNWISEDGKETIVARSCKSFPYVYDAWDFDKPMGIKRCYSNNYYSRDRYDINANYIYPHRNILSILLRNGFTLRCKTLAPNLIMKLLLTDREDILEEIELELKQSKEFTR